MRDVRNEVGGRVAAAFPDWQTRLRTSRLHQVCIQRTRLGQIFCSQMAATHIYKSMSGFIAVSPHGCFLRSTVNEHGLVESLCVFCARRIYSAQKEILVLAEHAHSCSAREQVRPSPPTAR